MEDKSKESILKSYLSIKPINTKRAVSLHSSLQKKKLDFSKINNIKKYPQLNTERLLEYKKRKKINIKVTEYPLTSLGKSSLDISKKFVVPKNNLIPISYIQDINNSNNLEFKTNYILKYAQNEDSFFKLKKSINLIRDEKKRNFEDIYLKIQKSLETQSKFFFDDKLFENENNNNDISFMKNMICFFYDYNFNLNKFCNLLVNELKNEKEQNSKLVKKMYEQNLRLTSKTKEYNELNEYITKYDTKFSLNEKKEDKIKEIKNKSLKKENAQLLSIFNLEEEIKDLTELLDKNKEYYNKFKESQNLVEEKQRKNDQMRFAYTKELNDKNIQFAIEKDKQNELIFKVNDLEKLILDYKKKDEQYKRHIIELQAQVKKLQMIIDEKIENIYMLNEEFETFYREYNKEKINHQHTFQALQTLENKFIQEKEERELKEKEEKEKEEKEKDDKKNEENKEENKKEENKNENKEEIKENKKE